MDSKKVGFGLLGLAAALGVVYFLNSKNDKSEDKNKKKDDEKSSEAQEDKLRFSDEEFAQKIQVQPLFVKMPEIFQGFRGRYLRFSFVFQVKNKSDKGQAIELKNIVLLHKSNPITRLETVLKQFIQPRSEARFDEITFEVPLSTLEKAGVNTFSVFDRNIDAKAEAAKLHIKATIEANLSTANILMPVVSVAVAGLGLVAKRKRVIRPRTDYLHLISGVIPLENTNPIIDSDGDVNRTVELMGQIVKKYKNDTKRLADSLKGKRLVDTLNNIFQFVYNYIQYVPDSPRVEQLRRPLRTLMQQTGDCDCYSILIASMLENLNIPYKFRITAYSNPARFQHVYVIVPKSGGGHYTVDPVLDDFNYEKPYSNKFDYKP